MNKAEFMRRLERGLRWTLPRKDVDDILADYEGFFTSDTAEGRAETDVAAELGEPAAVVRELIASYRGNKRLVTAREATRFIRRVVLSAIVVWAILEMSWYNVIGFSLVVLAAFTAEMWFTLGGRLSYPPGISCPMEKKDKRLLFTLHGCAVFLAGTPFAALGIILSFAMNPENMGWLYSNIIMATGIAALIVLFLAFNSTKRRSLWYFTVISHISGVIAELIGFWVLMHGSTGHLVWELLQRVFIYGSGLVLTMLYALVVRTLARRER